MYTFMHTPGFDFGANEDGSYTEKKVRCFTQVMQAGFPVFHVYCSRMWFDSEIQLNSTSSFSVVSVQNIFFPLLLTINNLW